MISYEPVLLYAPAQYTVPQGPQIVNLIKCLKNIFNNLPIRPFSNIKKNTMYTDLFILFYILQNKIND